ncbi:MAG: hypothetical protein NC314_01700 [Roseburia sp.]|nr:hypothetical protein [Roseburia sp.]MCM1241529.1 hypothetical protein [Roseburia sp.]
MPLKERIKKVPGIYFVLVILTVNALYWCMAKEGYYIDELWSYGLSNGYNTPLFYQTEEYMDNWHQPDFYEEYLTVQPEERFAYASVYDNQVHDVHPPLYYILLHTVCSLFPGRFSKWFGLLVNLPFYCGAVLLLYKISGQVLGKKSRSRVIPPLLYGLSVGAVATLIYIRMYMLLTFWALLLVFLVFRLIREQTGKKRLPLLVMISLTITAGFLTQYYFAIFAFFLSAVYIIRGIFLRRWREAAGYATAACAGIMCGILVFPASLQHIFRGQQGQRAFDNAANGFRLFFEHWSAYQGTVMSEFFGNERIGQIFLLVVLLGLMPVYIYSAKKKKQKIIAWNIVLRSEWFLLFAAVIGYFSVIIQISPEVIDRYQFMIYPFGVLLITAAVVYLLGVSGKEWFVWMITGGCLLLILWAYAIRPVPYTYEGYQEVLDRLGTEYRDAPGIYVTAGDHLLINNCLFFTRQERTYPLTLEQAGELPVICEGMETEYLVLYVDIYYDEWQTAERVAELLGYRSFALLYDNTFTQIFLLAR